MRVVLDLPDWVEGKHLFILAGIEMVAFKYVGEKWMVKSGRCSICGKCCIKKGVPCEHLEQFGSEIRCGLGIKRPLNCSMSAQQLNIEGCTEIFKEVK